MEGKKEQSTRANGVGKWLFMRCTGKDAGLRVGLNTGGVFLGESKMRGHRGGV